MSHANVRDVNDFGQRVRDSFSRQPFMSTLGAELVALRQGFVEVRVPFSSRLTQQNDFLHAGVITSVLDCYERSSTYQSLRM